MRFSLSIFLLFVMNEMAWGQFRWDCGVKTGASNYLGDIGGSQRTRQDFVTDLKLAETKLSFGCFGRYKIRKPLSFQLSYNYGRIAGNDKLSQNPGRHNRNLSFRNDIHEVALEAQLNFYTLDDLGNTYTYRNSMVAYLGLGTAVYHHNPKTYYQGEWVALQPLQTERQEYSLWGISIPMSMGLQFTIAQNYRIEWVLGWRKTFTDYLDDVSQKYPPPKALTNPLAIALSNRTGELNLPETVSNNYLPGSKRGDPTHNDAYIFSTINFSYVFRGQWFKKNGIYKHGRLRNHQKKTIRVRF
jgi:hypothetical protein